MRKYFYSLLARYIGVYVRPEDTLVEVDAASADLSKHFSHVTTACLRDLTKRSAADEPVSGAESAVLNADYLLLNGVLHFERDIQTYLKSLRTMVPETTRLILIYYSSLYRPLLSLASRLGMRIKSPEVNWLAHSDIANLLYLADFEILRLEQKVLLPIHVPVVSALVNRYLAPLPFFRWLCMANIVVARPVAKPLSRQVSVSIVIPARNEAGNIESAVLRTPLMGPDDELIFVEGGSNDDTWERILEVQRKYGTERKIVATRQNGKGKGDAVRKGFSIASNDILMILDADLTVPPEDLPKFYEPLVSGKGEFINGSRLVYPMQSGAMRFFNLLGNKFFASAFSFVLGQEFKDTLCGTKVLSKSNYERLVRNRSFFGEFDPFGDFDLIFGAARMCLRIVEVPIAYRERTYGTTNISRWRHGMVLLTMLGFAARRLKFI